MEEQSMNPVSSDLEVQVDDGNFPISPPTNGMVIHVDDDLNSKPQSEAGLKAIWEKYVDTKNKIKLATRQIKDQLLEHYNFAQADEEVKAKAKIRKEIRNQVISEDPALFSLVESLKVLKDDFGAIEVSLGGHVVEYEKETGQLSIFDGQVEFEKVIRVKKN